MEIESKSFHALPKVGHESFLYAIASGELDSAPLAV
jgi:hypothetical protein